VAQVTELEQDPEFKSQYCQKKERKKKKKGELTLFKFSFGMEVVKKKFFVLVENLAVAAFPLSTYSALLRGGSHV
jgi:hypothetical protein